MSSLNSRNNSHDDAWGDSLPATAQPIRAARSFIDVLQLRAKAHPNRPAFHFMSDGEEITATLTYAQLDQRARAIACSLLAKGKPGDRALMFYPHGLSFIEAFWGCLYAGIVPAPAYPPRRTRNLGRLTAMYADAQAALALTTSEQVEDIRAFFAQESGDANLSWIATDACRDSGDDWRYPSVDRNTLAFLQYTSGSTSTPKGVMVSHGNILHNTHVLSVGLETSEEMRTGLWLPQFHDMGLIGGVLTPTYSGGYTITMSPVHFLQKPARWLKMISRYRATHAGGPNFAYDLCLSRITADDMANLDLSSWNVAFSAAEPVRAATVRKFTETFAPYGFRPEAFMPCYGMAEITVGATWGRVDALPIFRTFSAEHLRKSQTAVEAPQGAADSQELVGCGVLAPTPEQFIRVVDPERRILCAEGQVGELWMSSPSVALGYWNKPEETADTFSAVLADTGESPFLRTGDLGFVKDDQLFIAGRLKDIIIIRGTNHYPQDIEESVESCHPALRLTCCAAFSVDIEGEERLVVVQEVERQHIRQLNVDEVAATIRHVVAENHSLDVYAVVLIKPSAIAKTSSGKIQRRANKTAFLARTLEAIGESIQDTTTISPAIAASDSESATEEQAGKRFYERVCEFLTFRIAQRTKVDPSTIDIQQPFTSFGLNSVAAVELAADLENFLGRKLSATLVYEYPSIDSLAHFLSGTETPVAGPVRIRPQGEPIAIIGMSCRFPGAPDIESYWSLLRDGIDAIRETPKDRWNIDDVYDPQEATPGKMVTKWGGFIDNADQFDAAFFGFSPREMASMDPQQRLVMEVAWEAIENAGIPAESLIGSETGSFIGIGPVDYVQLLSSSNAELDAYVATGNAQCISANRLSYFLDFRGPSMAIDTACSSSLVAVHQACQALRNRECNLSLAGGVNMLLGPWATIVLSQARMMSPKGRCSTYDADADGYVRGEGCGIVVLKRLSDALADGNNVLAVIRGTAVNHDGRSNGLTAPNVAAQQAVIRAALQNAGVAPSEVSCIEAHGTGTALGDPIEINALKSVLMDGREAHQPCFIGSVKTNIGHLETAAGVAGLIKMVLSLQHGEIPPHLHLKKLNPLIAIDGTPLSIPTESQSWPKNARRRLGGVSAFGFGGTNAHVIVEEAPRLLAKSPSGIERNRHVLTLSARCEEALAALAARYAGLIDEDTPLEIGSLCHASNTSRTSLEHRIAIVTEPVSKEKTLASLKTTLMDIAQGKDGVGCVKGIVAGRRRPKVAFLFTGQGAQYAGMGRQLYETEPVFRRSLDQCDVLLRGRLQQPLLSVLYPESETSALLDQTAYTQPALFALEYSLAMLWKSWGITPDVVMGHSVGEVSAACYAGMFSLEDGLNLIAERGRLIQSLPSGGGMAAVFLDHESTLHVLKPYQGRLHIAAVNGPNLTVVSGDMDALESLLGAFGKEGVKTTLMTVSHAFHSHHMDPILPVFAQATAHVRFLPLQIPLVSNKSRRLLDAGETTDSGFWVEHIRDTVQFDTGMKLLAEMNCDVYLEIGPSNTLIGMGKRCVPKNTAAWLTSLSKDPDNERSVLSAAGSLFTRGAVIDWNAVEHGFPHRRVNLPTYPFQRKRFWFKPGAIQEARTALEVTATTFSSENRREIRETVSNWLYEVVWQGASRVSPTSGPSENWLLFADDNGVGLSLKAHLEALEQSCTVVTRGRNLSVSGEEWVIDAMQPHHYDAAIKAALTKQAPSCLGIVYLWGLDQTNEETCSEAEIEARVRRSTTELLHITKTLIARAPTKGAPKLHIVTKSCQRAVEPDSVVSPSQNSLWGFGRCIALEHPDLFGKLIDLADASNDADLQLATEEMVCADSETMVSIRNGNRYVARLGRLQPKPIGSSFPCRADSTYLVTGGLGGLGLKVSEWLVGRGARRLLFLTRTPVTARHAWSGLAPGTKEKEIVAALKKLESLGATIHTATVDVGDAAKLEEFLASYDSEQWPPIRGIIHAAGVLQDSLIHKMDANSFELVNRSKVRGTWALHRAFADRSLDFFVMFSSAASLLGSVAQANYAAANAFMDAVAYSRRLKGLPATSINWGPWTEVGMAARPDRGGRMAQHGMAGIDPDHGVEALGMLIEQNPIQAGVLNADWAQIRDAIGDAPGANFLSLLAEGSHSKTPSDIAVRVRQSNAEERRALLMEHLRGSLAGVLQQSAASIPVDQNVITLGMDSIMVMDLIRSVERDLHFRVHPREVFDQPTLQGLANYIATEIEIASQERTGEAPPEEGYIRAGLERMRKAMSSGPSVKPEKRNRPCVFLISAPRSGSTLLRVMLAGHPCLFSPPELHLLHFNTMHDFKNILVDKYQFGDGFLRAFMDLKGVDADQAQAIIDGLISKNVSIQDAFSVMQELAAPRIVVDKSPTYTGNPEALQRAEDYFEQAKYIYLFRHPYAVVESYVRNRTGKMFDFGHVDPFLLAEEVWTVNNENVLAFLKTVPSERQHWVRYEEMTTEPDPVMRRMCDFLDLPFHEGVLNPYGDGRMTDGVRAESRSVGDPNFLKHTGIDADLAEAWRRVKLPRPLGVAAQKVAVELNYELPNESVAATVAARGAAIEELEEERL